MRLRNPRGWIRLLPLLAALTISALTADPVDVALPAAEANTYETVSVPLTCADVTGQDVYAFFARVSYDPAVATCVGVDTTGTLAADWGTLTCNTTAAGQFAFSLFGTTPLAGGGNLIKLRMRILTTEDAATALSFQQVRFNEGNPAVAPQNGWLEVTNRRPWFSPLDVQLVDEGQTMAFTAVAHDPLSLPLSLDAANLPAGALFTDNGDGTGTFSWQTDDTSAGSYTLPLTATNSQGFADTTLVSLNVREVLDVTLPDAATPPGQAFSLPVTTTNTQSLGIYSVYCAVEVNPAVAQFTGVNNTDCITASWGEPTYNVVNPGRVVVSLFGSTALTGAGALFNLSMQAVGNLGDTAPVTFDFFWYNEGDPVAATAAGLLYLGPPNPWFLPCADVTVDEFDEVDIAVTAQDPLLHTLTLSASQIPAGAGFIDHTDGAGTLHWATDQFSAGDYDVRFMVTNAEDYTDTLFVRIHVNNVPQAPYVSAPMSDVLMDMNTQCTTAPMTDVFTDIDGSPAYTLSGNTHIQAVLNGDDTWTLSPEADWYGVETLYFTATDDDDLSATDIVQVQVTGLLDIGENFNHGGAAPTGWTVINGGTTAATWAIVNDNGADYSYKAENAVLTNSDERLRSPVYDFSQYEDVTVGFTHALTANTACTALFQRSTDGITWTTVGSYTASTSGTVSFNISSWADGAGYVQFQWRFTSTSYNYASWDIDDLLLGGFVVDNTPPADIADLNVTAYDENSVTLAWSPVTDPNFSAYEVYVSTDATVSTADALWGEGDDPLLQDAATGGTTVTDLTFNQRYWFAVRGVDAFGNAAELSNTVTCLLAFPPDWSEPWPADPQWTASRTQEVGGTVTDDATVDAATLQVRVDANGNGAYDAAETWTSITGYANAQQIAARAACVWSVDGDSLRYELRAQDTMQSGWAYSGTAGVEGIEDDWFVRIDTAPPTLVTGLAVTAASGGSVSLAWSPVSEPHFGRYEVYYAAHEGITTADRLWTTTNDAALANIATGGTTVTGLAADSLYWFAARAVDGPGNAAALCAEVPGVPHSLPPTCASPWPQGQPAPQWSTGYTVTVGCTFADYFGVDSTSVQVRCDANGNGVYDETETWQNVYGARFALRSGTRQTLTRTGQAELTIRTNVTYAVEGEALAFELRAWDIHGYGPVYSGSGSAEGIADDWRVRIDATAPATIDAAATGAVTAASIEMLWLVSADEHFAGYEVYYATHEGVSLADSVWTFADDPNLVNPGEGFTTTVVTGLHYSTTYWLRVRAVDEAGNASPLSMEVSAVTESIYPPLPPQNLRIVCSGVDVHLSWDAVTQNVNGEPITVSQYAIYAADTADFPATIDYLVATTPDTAFVHSGALSATRIYYRVSAVQGTLRQGEATQP